MGRLSRVAKYLDDSCRTWIGETIPPARRVLEQTDWVPDSETQYCRRCGESVGPGEGTDGGCATCREKRLPFEATIRLGSYEGELREWILGIKYSAWDDMGRLLGQRLALAVREAGVVDRSRTVIVPMPMPWLRRVHRGMDHAASIARGVAREFDAPVVRMLAKQNGTPQVAVTRTERRRNGGRGMRVRRRLGGWPVQELHLLVVDDVRTTGSTIRAAGRLLRRLQPARLVAAVVAVADEHSRARRAELAAFGE